MIRQTFFRLFWNTYDALGAWVLIGIAASLASLPLVTAPAAWGGVLACAARVDQERGIGLRDWAAGVAAHWKASTALGLAIGLGAALCLLNIVFYLNPAFIPALPRLLRIALACLFLWAMVFGLIGLSLAWAFLILQGIAIRKALKRGFLVLLSHPVSLLFLLFVAAAIVVLLALSVVGLLFLPVLLGNLAMGAAAGAVEYYEEKDDRALRARFEREGHRSWTELRQLEEREAARFRRHSRGWREIFKPWELP